MVVHFTTRRGNNPWAFLSHLVPTWDLQQEPFSSLQEWFSLATLFFTHREKIKSNSRRIVTIIWLFVILLLTSNYTANLTPIVTVKQLTPTITSVESIQNKELQ
ncbi:hypothetical protein SUGI_0461450 [Cryptomeria japonica]|nr:hypothetical protein SUGI_0461450 [Cryptomeria japonica]